MKFNCDRCKTRYSISDDRVRGKILKIRCKNCSAVITVREGMSIAAPRVPASARRPTAPPPKAPPPPPTPKPMVVEWFLSIDGEQVGPFGLERARRWVAEQPSSAELYCWSEGFDDWLPVEKVSHFRGLRRTSGLLGRDPHEKTPAPLFAATMQQMTAEAPTLLEDENPFSAAYERKKRETASQQEEPDPAPEPSYMLPITGPAPPPPARQASDPGPLLAPSGEELPQLSGLTMPDMPRPEVLPPARRRSIAIPLIAAGLVILVILGVLLYLALRGGDDSSQGVTRSGSRSASLARSVDDPERPPARPSPADAGAAPEASSPRAPRPRAAAGRPKAAGEPASTTYTAPAGEVDLSGVGSSTGEVKQGTLEPGDIATVYRKRQFSVNRCYENAVKRDPLLQVPKTHVTLEVAGSGRVTRVSIPSLAKSSLGSCLVTSISRWTFPRSTEGFAGRFPIVFRSR